MVGVLTHSGSLHARHVALCNTHRIDGRPSVHMLMIDCQLHVLVVLREGGKPERKWWD